MTTTDRAALAALEAEMPGALAYAEESEQWVAPADGSIVEAYVAGHGPSLGIVSNLPKRRVVGRVTRTISGTIRVHFGGPDDGSMVLVSGTEYRVLAAKAFAGWGSLS